MKHSRNQDPNASGSAIAVVSEARQARKLAGIWLKQRRADAGLSQVELAATLGLKYYTFISQVENGFSRIPTDMIEAWAMALGLDPTAVTRHLLVYYEPELNRLLFGVQK